MGKLDFLVTQSNYPEELSAVIMPSLGHQECLLSCRVIFCGPSDRLDGIFAGTSFVYIWGGDIGLFYNQVPIYIITGVFSNPGPTLFRHELSACFSEYSL